MKGKYDLEDGSSFDNAADTSTLFHPTKERPKFARRSLRERWSGKKYQKQRSNSTGDIVPSVVTSSSVNKTLDKDLRNTKIDEKLPPLVSPKPKGKAVQNITGNRQQVNKVTIPLKPVKLSPVKSPKPVQKETECEKDDASEKPLKQESSSKVSTQKEISDEQDKTTPKKNKEKRGKSIINEKTSAFLKGISKFGDSVTTRYVKHKKLSNDDSVGLVDPDENTNLLLENPNTGKMNSTTKKNLLVEDKEQSDSQTPNKTKVEKRKTSSVKLTLASPFKREKVKGPSATGTKYTKRTSPVNDRKSLVESMDCHGNKSEMDIDLDGVNKNGPADEHVDSEENLLASPVAKKSNLSDENNWWKSDRKVLEKFDPVSKKSECNNSNADGSLNDTKSVPLKQESPATPKSDFETLCKDSTILQNEVSPTDINNNYYNKTKKDNQNVSNGLKSRDERPLLHYQNLSFDASYTQPTVRKSYSIVTYTPKPARRKIDENGRIMTKKNCAQNNVLRSLSVSLKYENKAKNNSDKEFLNSDFETKRRYTFGGKNESPKKNFSSWARSSLRSRKDDQRNLINSSAFGTEDSDEDILLNDKIQQKSIQ